MLQGLNHDVLELHIPGMTLQTNVAFGEPRRVGRDRIVRNEGPIQRDRDGGARRLNFECIPLASGFRSEARGGRQSIDGARLMERIEIQTRIRVEPHVIDLNFITLVRCQDPILCGIAGIQRWKTKQDT